MLPIFLQKWQASWKILTFIVFSILSFWFFTSISPLKADIFEQTPTTSASDIYIPNVFVQKGKTGELALVVNKDMTMQGFSFELQYPTNHLTANGFSVETTALAGKNFLIQDNRNVSGKVTVVGASGTPVALKKGDVMLLLSFSISESLSADVVNIPLTFSSFKVVDDAMKESTLTAQGSQMSVVSSPVFSITRLISSAKGTIEIQFSDIVKTDLSLKSFLFTDEAVNTESILEKNGNIVTISKLNLVPGKRYTLTFHTDVQSEQGVLLHDVQRSIDFVVPNDGTPADDAFDSTLGIVSVSHKDATHFDFVLSAIPQGSNFSVSSIGLKNHSVSIPVVSIVQDSADKRMFHATTQPMSYSTPYVFYLVPELWKNAAGKKAGGMLSTFMITGEPVVQPTITSVSPARPVKGESTLITISGIALPASAKILVGTSALSSIAVSADKKTITGTLSSSLPVGAYTLEMQWTENNESKNLKVENAIVIEEKMKSEIIVVSDKSYGSPAKIPNDGKTTAKIFVYVDDPRGLADIDTVMADLRVIGGSPASVMKAGAIENGQQIFYLENITVPQTVATQTYPYKIPVIAQNKSGLSAEGFISLWVSKDTTASVPPRILKFSITPSSITPGDSTNPLLISSEISDEDSGEEITTVAVDLTPLGLNTLFLTARNSGQATAKTKYFESTTPIVVPVETQNGEYIIKLKAIDAHGDEAVQETKVTVQRNSNLGPSMTTEDTYVTPSNSLIKDGKFSFAVHTKVSDPSGSDNIQSVSVNLSSVGLPPVVMNAGAKEGRSQWFSSSVLYIPDAVEVGKKRLLVTAVDKQGNSYTHDVWVEVMYKKDAGRAPIIENDKNYITPNRAINDGKTSFSAYVFVKDIDDDISHVVLKLENTALFNGTSLPKGASGTDSAGNEVCISTRTLLCMQPILKEANGQWYYLSDLIVPNTTAARDTPYTLQVNAFDKTGKIAEGKLDIIVASASHIISDAINEIIFIQATSPTTLQILLKDPLDAKTFKKEWLSISSAENASDMLSILDISISPDGKLITLKTAEQTVKKTYALTVDAEKMNIGFTTLASRVYPFSAFEKPTKTPTFQAISAASLSATSISVVFSHPLNARSMLNPENIEIFVEGKKERLTVHSLKMIDEKTIKIETDAQPLGQKYDLYYKNIESLYGDIISKKQAMKLDGYSMNGDLAKKIGALQNTADFNNDGIVDFKDFTLFAAVYGKTYEQAASGDLNADKTVDFKDFTMFSAMYGQVMQPSSASSGSSNHAAAVSRTPAPSGNVNSVAPSVSNGTLFVPPTPFVVAPSSVLHSAAASPLSSAAPTPTASVSKTPTPVPQQTQTSAPSQTTTPTPISTTTPTITPTNTAVVSPTASSSSSTTSSPAPTCTSDPLTCLLSS